MCGPTFASGHYAMHRSGLCRAAARAFLLALLSGLATRPGVPTVTGEDDSRLPSLASTPHALRSSDPGSGASLPPTGRAATLARLPFDRLSGGLYWMLVGEREAAQNETASVRGIAPAASGLPGPAEDEAGNVRLGDDPTGLPATRRAQAEPHVARSVKDPGLLLATFQEGRYADGGAVNNGYALSRDGGQTWERALIPHLIAAVDGGPFGRASDPVAGIDLEGHLYLNSLALSGASTHLRATVVVTRSRDGGRSWSAPLTAAATDDPAVFLDKNWMAINTFPATPTANRIVVSYTRFETLTEDDTIDPIEVTFSDDQGETWSAPRTVSPPICQGSQPVFLPDGSLAVVYWHFMGTNGHQLEMVWSADGGTDFSPPRRVAPVALYSDPVARSGAFLPSAAADRELGVLHVVCQAWDSAPRILYTRSRDRGLTWSEPVAINDTPRGASVFNPAVAVSADGQHVTVIFQDKRHDTTGGDLVDLYLAESFDGGESWEPNRRLTPVSSDLRLAPLTGQGRMLGDYLGLVPALSLEVPGWAVWVDTRTGSPDPFATPLRRDRGSTFEAWRRLAFTSEALANGSGEATADPDGDRMPNLAEYAVGQSPLRPDAPVVPGWSNGSVPGRWSTSVEVSVVANDVGVVWGESGDLRTWQPASPAATLVEPGRWPGRVRQRAEWDTGLRGLRFLTFGIEPEP